MEIMYAAVECRKKFCPFFGSGYDWTDLEQGAGRYCVNWHLREKRGLRRIRQLYSELVRMVFFMLCCMSSE